MNHVIVGLPCYDGTRFNGMQIARLMKQPPKDTLVNLIELKTSALAFGFNILWANMLNYRQHPEYPPTHYLLWHADVQPMTEDWLGVMLHEMEAVKADVLSAVIPIKNDLGATSTSVETDNPWRPRRYSQAEVHKMTVNPWTEPGLLINTGLMLVDFRKPWVEQIAFTMHDRVIYDEDEKTWKAQFQPEDWDFSRQCHKLGVSVYATKSILTNHIGFSAFRSDHIWGFASDEEYLAAQDEQKGTSA